MPGRRVASVSELYAADEVELLLEEIRHLEPRSCPPDDIQDFEIAGSRTGAASGGAGGGGRSPAATERSWDSHAHYRRAPPPSPAAVAPLLCRAGRLASARGALRALLVCAALACCGCAWGAAGAQPSRLPLPGRLQLLLLAALSSAMLHALFLFLDVTGLQALFPFDFDKLTMWASTWSICSLTGGSGLVMHAALNASEYRYAPERILQLMLASAGLGLCGAAAALALALVALRRWARSGALRGRRRSSAGPASQRRRSSASAPSLRAYRPLPLAAPPEPQPGTSRRHPDDPL